MRQLGLVACQPGPWRPTTTKQGQAGPIPDLVNQDFTAETPGAKMAGDITCIETWEGCPFLATVIHCATRKVIGWAVDDNYRTPLITSAMRPSRSPISSLGTASAQFTLSKVRQT